jgi:Flp pilus assembly protein TadG
LVVVLGVAALAIDVTILYLAQNEGQKAADAVALAGAKALLATSFTSGGDAAIAAAACNAQAIAAANLNKIAGTAPTTVTPTCDLGNLGNPHVSVTITRTGLPRFFSRVWSRAPKQVSAVANG